MQQFSLVYNNLYVFLEPVDELRPTYDCGQLMQGTAQPVNFVTPVKFVTCYKSIQGLRRGYLGSTLLACRAVAPPHIKLEICIKSFSVE